MKLTDMLQEAYQCGGDVVLYEDARSRIVELEEALRSVRDKVDDLSWDMNRNCDHIFKVIDEALNPKKEDA